MLEVGSGVGAQTEILLRHFPEIHITGVEINDDQIAEARRYLATVPWATDRYTITKGDATRLEFPAESFDGAFLCWILEHISSPARVLSEVRRVLAPGAPIYAHALVGMVTFVGRWWTETHKPSVEEVASHLSALAWMGLRHLPKKPAARRR